MPAVVNFHLATLCKVFTFLTSLVSTKKTFHRYFYTQSYSHDLCSYIFLISLLLPN
nr:MAG TPA: hypothetical protein [Caudoviricetes sp.]